MSDRKNPWLYEQDGDLNPTWLFVVLFLVLGAAAAVVAALSAAASAKIAALSYLGTMTVALLISALPRDRAKILAKSRALGDVARGIASVPTYGEKTEQYDVDEVLR